jgi:hypothetical protein
MEVWAHGQRDKDVEEYADDVGNDNQTGMNGTRRHYKRERFVLWCKIQILANRPQDEPKH